MSNLACADCKALHDFDLAPDTGTCIVCGGNLVEDETEREEVGVGALRAGLKEVAETVKSTNEKFGVTTGVADVMATKVSLGRGKNQLS